MHPSKRSLLSQQGFFHLRIWRKYDKIAPIYGSPLNKDTMTFSLLTTKLYSRREPL